MNDPKEIEFEYSFATRAVHDGQIRSTEGEQAEPIFTTSSYVFANAAQAAARFSGESPGNIYSRFTNPTVRNFEQRLASLEGGESCVATASGMSAILAMCMALLRSGDHVIASQSIFGTTVLLFSNILARFGVVTDFVPIDDVNAWKTALRPNTKLLFLETPSNPLCKLADIKLIAELAHHHGALLAVDNAFCTPALQRPLELGADLVIHSATKYIDGQGRCLGGAVVGNRTLVGEGVYGFIRTAGPSMSPFNAWVFLKGLETLGVRMAAHCAAAMSLAKWLLVQPKVVQVYYPGLTNHLQHELALRQQQAFGGIVAFDLDGGRKTAWQFINAVKLFSITANLGDTKSTITHPASTTHGRLTPAERTNAGINEGLIRISVGLEDVQDLITDLKRGFNAITD